MKFVFNIEPADRSVGIMSESFAGWLEGDGYWCELIEYTNIAKDAKFQWNDEEGNLVLNDQMYKIPHRSLVESLLFACIQGFYRNEE